MTVDQEITEALQDPRIAEAVEFVKYRASFIDEYTALKIVQGVVRIIDMDEIRRRRQDRAKQYVDDQLDTMKKFGAAPLEISTQEYQSLIDKVAAHIKTDRASS